MSAATAGPGTAPEPDTYGDDLASVYDQVYVARGKDHAAEVDQVLALAGAHHPGPTSLLDVACGTGLHLVHAAARVPRVAGLELSPAMLAAARRRLPGATLVRGDMRDFALEARFSVVTCMFSSIGYMRDQAELDAAVGCMARHLEPSGVLVVEPWWFPEQYLPGYVAGDVSTVDGRTVARVSHSSLDGGRSVLEVHVTVADAAGVRHFVDRHEVTLFRREQYEDAFRAAGLDVRWHAGGPSGRGLFVGARDLDAPH